MHAQCRPDPVSRHRHVHHAVALFYVCGRDRTFQTFASCDRRVRYVSRKQGYSDSARHSLYRSWGSAIDRHDEVMAVDSRQRASVARRYRQLKDDLDFRTTADESERERTRCEVRMQIGTMMPTVAEVVEAAKAVCCR